MTQFTLSDLDRIVSRRAEVTDGSSYTASLISRGVEKCAQKLGEEAVEAAIAAVAGRKSELTGEAADVLYHLLVLLNASGVSLDAVMAELATRTSRSGLEEKAARAGPSSGSQ